MRNTYRPKQLASIALSGLSPEEIDQKRIRLSIIYVIKVTVIHILLCYEYTVPCAGER